MLNIYVMIGIPASGKSTWAKKKVEETGAIRINRDDLRKMLHNDIWSKENEKSTIKARNSLIAGLLDLGKDVIIDDTNIDSHTNWELENVIETWAKKNNSAVCIVRVMFNTPLEVCLERNSKREKPVPIKFIEECNLKLSKLDPKVTDKTVTFDYSNSTTGKMSIHTEGLPWCILIDLDGTTAIKHEGRGIFDFSTCDKDHPNLPVIETIRALYSRTKYIIVAVTGREDYFREQTERFLKEYIPEYQELHMRKIGDNRKDSIIKKEILFEEILPIYNVFIAFDDRNQVVEAYRSVGIKVMQVADGNF